MNSNKRPPHHFSSEVPLRKLQKIQNSYEAKEKKKFNDPSTSNVGKDYEIQDERDEKTEIEQKQLSNEPKTGLNNKDTSKGKQFGKKILKGIPYPYPQDESQIISSSFSFVFSIFKRNLRNTLAKNQAKKQKQSSSQTSRSEKSQITPLSDHLFPEDSLQIESESSYCPQKSQQGNQLNIPDQLYDELSEKYVSQKQKTESQAKQIHQYNETDLTLKSKQAQNIEQNQISPLSNDQIVYLDDFLFENARYRLSMPKIMRQIRQIRLKLNKVKTYEIDKRAKISEKHQCSTKEQIDAVRKIKYDEMRRRMAIDSD